MIRKLARSIREYKKIAILSPVAMIGEVVMEVVIPLLMAYLIDNGINAGDMGTIWKAGLGLVACAIVSLVCGVLAGALSAKASAGFGANLRKDMYYAVQKYSFSNIDKFSTGSIVTRLTTDVSNIQNVFQMIIRMAVRAPMMLIFSVIMAVGISGQLSLVFFAAKPVLALGLGLI